MNTNSLSELIGSLSKSEKRYFRLFASVQRGDKMYLRLFDVYENGDNPEQMPAGSALPIKRLPDARQYLYFQLLKVLHYYHSGIDPELSMMLHQAGILYEKALYGQSFSLLRKAKQTALQYEKYTALMDILEWEKRLVIASPGLKHKGMDTEGHTREGTAILERIRNTFAYGQLRFRIYSIIQQIGLARTVRDLHELRSVMRHPMMRKRSLPGSFGEKHNLLQTCALYYFATGDAGKAYRYNRELIRLTETYPLQAVADRHLYLSVLYNYLSVALLAGKSGDYLKDELFNTALGRLRDACIRFTQDKPSAVAVTVRAFNEYHTIELMRFIKEGDFEKGLAIVPEIESGILKFGSKLSEVNRAFLFYRIAFLCFIAGKYDEALHWINRVLNEMRSEVRYDLHAIARILSLIIHAELKNNDLLEYMVRSTYRYLHKRNRLYLFEKVLLQFIQRRLPGIASAAGLIAAYRNLKMRLEKVSRDPFEKKILEYFDFISWLEAKISGRPFAEIVKEKAAG